GKPYNGELLRLRTLLQQSTGAGGKSSAEVIIEVHQESRIVALRVNRMRVTVDPDLPSRIASVLHGSARCELVGPPKLGARHSGPVVEQQPLLRRGSSSSEEVCASIDRY